MPIYRNLPSAITTGTSSMTVDNKLIEYGKICNRVEIQSAKPNINIKNSNLKSINNSYSLLSNKKYNSLKTIKPLVVTSLKIIK